MGDWEQILLERRLLWWTSLLVLAGTGLWVLALATPYWLIHLPGNNTHTPVGTRAGNEPSLSLKLLTYREGYFSWLKAATSAFTFKNLIRHYAKPMLTLGN